MSGTASSERAGGQSENQKPKGRQMTTKAKHGMEWTGRELRYLADGYETAQRLRIETGERIRAVVQGRDETFIPLGSVTMLPGEEGEDPRSAWIDEAGVARDADDTLAAIQMGKTIGPVPILGRSHHRYWTEERDTFSDMSRSLRAHPAFGWLDQVPGIGPTLACKLLARFDATKADHASSFWAYAGLATVPGDQYRCETCHLVRSWPTGFNVTGTHQALGTTRNCKGSLVKIAGPEDGIRSAQPKPSRGTKATYDQYAKKVMYLAGMSFLKVPGSFYEQFYRRERAKVDREHGHEWADGKRHFWALRKVQKLFLSNLWEIWRTALGLPVTDPWAFASAGHDLAGKVSPWDVVKK